MFQIVLGALCIAILSGCSLSSGQEFSRTEQELSDEDISSDGIVYYLEDEQDEYSEDIIGSLNGGGMRIDFASI